MAFQEMLVELAGGLEIRGASGTYEPGIALDNGSQQWNIVAWGDNSLQFTKISGATFSPFRIHSNSFHNALVIGQLGVGINNPTPTEELDVDGNIAVSGTVDGVDISELAARGANYTQLGGLNNSSVNITSTMTVLGTGTKTFTKIHPDSKIEVYVYSRMGAGSFNSTNGVRFQAWVDGNAPMISSEGAITSTNSIDFLSFFSVYEGLATGSHTVTIRARAASNGGTSTGVLSDPGGYGGRIIVKETW